MSNHQRKTALAARPSQTEASPKSHTSEVEVDAQQLQRFLQNPTSSPHLMRAAQQHLGNQGIQRLMRQTQTTASLKQTKPRSIQRVALIQQRAGQGALQRGPISWIKNKFKKWVNKQATEATFGKDAERQADPAENYLDVADANKASFSAVQSIDIKSGPRQEHTLKGRHYLAKDPGKGAYAGKTVLFLSGSAGVAEDYSKDSAIHYCKEGANLLAVNYRGFGRSKTSDAKGDNRKMGHNELKDTMLYEDSRAMFEWLRGTGVDAGSVIVHGYSLGGAMAAQLVASLADEGIRVSGLVLHSAIDSARKVAVRGQGKFQGNIGADNLGSDFDTSSMLDDLSKHPEMLDLPIAVISGAKDQGDHLDDKETGLSTQLTKLGFTDVGSKRHDEKGHAPDHADSWKVSDVLKKQLGAKAKPKVEDVVETV